MITLEELLEVVNDSQVVVLCNANGEEYDKYFDKRDVNEEFYPYLVMDVSAYHDELWIDIEEV